MAIYSFNHDSFGRTNKRAGAAAQNASYNARESETRLPDVTDELGAAENAAYNARAEATYAVRSHVIPPGPDEAEAWFRQKELGARKNARMSDRFIGALPRELTPEQCIEAVEAFCREVTQDRVPWHFALHLELEKKGDKDWNPHAHIIIHDRDIETGRRYLYTSAGSKERKQLDAKSIRYWSTNDFREKWSVTLNRALERAGRDERVDHRSLEEQGIDRKPQMHVGPGAQNAGDKDYPFQSQDRMIGNRAVPYTILDRGTRLEHNQSIIAENDNREQTAWKAMLVADGPKTREEQERRQLIGRQTANRRQMYNDQQKDRAALRQLHAAGLIKHRTWAKQQNQEARATAYAELKDLAKPLWKNVRAMKNRSARAEAAVTLKIELKQTYKIIKTKTIEALKPTKDAAWKALSAEQQKERDALGAQHQNETIALAKQHMAERLAILETIRAAELQRQTNAVNARIGGGQGMVNQQSAAHALVKLNHKERETKAGGTDIIQIPANPIEAAKHYARQAEDAAQTKTKDRMVLNGQRQEHVWKAAEQVAAPRRSRRGRAGEALTRITMVANHGVERARQKRMKESAERGKAQSFKSGFAKRHPAAAHPSAGRSMTTVVRDEKERANRQQAARDGKPLTDADRLNTAAEARNTAPKGTRGDRPKSDRELLREVLQETRGPGRDRGGGRGR